MAKNELQKQGRIVMLPVDCIEPSPYQARTAFDEPEIAALAVSILQNGLLQPISVRRVVNLVKVLLKWLTMNF